MASLVEHTLCEARSDSIDKEAGSIRNVKVLGRDSKRGRRYTDKALQDAARLYEGMRVNFDHPRDESRPGVVRGFFEQIGQLEGCHVKPDGVYANRLNYLKSHPGAPLLIECVERFPNLLGLSHNANGPKRRDGDTWIVEGIDEVLSVDIVTRPATTSGLFESEDDMPQLRTLKLKAILESVKSETPLSKRLKSLIEADVAMADMTAELPAESDPNEDVKAALAKAAQSIVRKMIDGDMEQQAGFKKLKELLGMAEKATADDSGKAPEPPAAMESLQREFTALKCKNLLLESGREGKAEWIEALSAVPEASRSKLLESLPKPAAKGSRPASSPGVLQESARGAFTPSTDSKDFLSKVRSA